MTKRMWSGQKLVRLNEIYGSAGPKAGEVVTVKAVIDVDYITLEEHPGYFLRSQFTTDDTPMEELPNYGKVTELELLSQALHVIDKWNRTRPTSMMISIEAYPAQDGGSVFSTGSMDSNNVNEFTGMLLEGASAEERAYALELAAKALRETL